MVDGKEGGLKIIDAPYGSCRHQREVEPSTAESSAFLRPRPLFGFCCGRVHVCAGITLQASAQASLTTTPTTCTILSPARFWVLCNARFSRPNQTPGSTTSILVPVLSHHALALLWSSACAESPYYVQHSSLGVTLQPRSSLLYCTLLLLLRTRLKVCLHGPRHHKSRMLKMPQISTKQPKHSALV